MKKALVKNKKKYATFMFIPESQSSVKSYRVPTWIPKFTASFIILFVLTSATCFFMLSSLKLKYESSITEIEKLAAINNSQKVEIEKLQESSEKVQAHLEENSQILEEVKQAVGLTSSASGKSTEIKLASLNDISLAKLPEGNTGSDMSEKIASIESDFKSLADKIAAQKQIINESLGPIKSQLAYLKAKPSIMPVSASITSGFGYRKSPFTSRGSEFHKGVDFAAYYGQTVSSTGDGMVIFSGWHAGYGRTVIISHGYGITTLYGHNSKLLVKQGDKVKKGQAIAKAGNTGRSTGTHLHYEVKLNGKNVNPSNYFD